MLMIQLFPIFFKFEVITVKSNIFWKKYLECSIFFCTICNSFKPFCQENPQFWNSHLGFNFQIL